MTRSEREKGARGEREVAAIFRAHGFDCERTPNSGGLRFRGDLLGLLGVHVEVKRQEIARPWAWWEQAKSEAAESVAPVMPLVAFRRNDSEWLAIVPLDALAEMMWDALTNADVH